MGSAEFLLHTLQRLDTLSSQISGHQGNGVAADVKGVNALNASMSSSNAFVQIGPPLILKESITTNADIGIGAEIQNLIEDAKQLVKNIQTCAEHQALITNNVLDLSKLDANKVEPVYDLIDIYRLGPQTVDMMQARAQNKNITLTFIGSTAKPLYLKADATILSQVLLNLVSNAIKVSPNRNPGTHGPANILEFTPNGGSIKIDMWPESTDSLGQEVVHFSVTDTGLGMTEAEKQRLFQRFSQANRRYGHIVALVRYANDPQSRATVWRQWIGS